MMANNELKFDRLGNYIVRRRLGVGAMGEVYEVYNDAGRFALKIMHEHLADDKKLQERFLREVRLMQAVQHPNIVPINDFGWYGPRLFFVMPYIEGTDLQAHMYQGRFTPRHIWEIYKPLAKGLMHAHQQGIIHRDLKPSNILVETETAHIYLVDFGLGIRPGLDPRLTESGIAVGTPAYMSPEVISGRDVDARADIYSLGVVLYELILNRLPFDAPQRSMVMYAHVYEDPPAPRTVDPDVPERLEQLIMGCMAKDPQARYSSIRHFMQDFADALQSMTPEQIDHIYAQEGG